MDPFGNDEIARLLRAKRYEQPPLPILRISVHEFRRRQRDELLRQPVWRICFDRTQGVSRSGTMSVPTLQASRQWWRARQ